MEKRKLSVLILSVLFLLGGCHSQGTELKDRFIVGSIGVDIADGEFTVILLGLVTTGENNSELTFLEGEGKTVFLALSDAAASTDKSLFFGHCDYLIFGAGAGMRNAGEVTKQLFSADFLPCSADVLTCETKAGALLRKAFDAEYSVCGALKTLMEKNGRERDLHVPMYSVVHAQITGRSYFLPYLHTLSTEEKTAQGEAIYTLRADYLCLFGPDPDPILLDQQRSSCVLFLSDRIRSIELRDDLVASAASGVYRLEDPFVDVSCDRKGRVNVQIIVSLRTKTTSSAQDAKTVSALKLENSIRNTLEAVLLQNDCDLWGLTNQSGAGKSVSVNDLRADRIVIDVHVRLRP